MTDKQRELKRAERPFPATLLLTIVSSVFMCCVVLGFVVAVVHPALTKASRMSAKPATEGLKSLGIAILLAKSDGKPCKTIKELVERKYLEFDPHADYPDFEFVLMPSTQTLETDLKASTIYGYAKRKDAGDSLGTAPILVLFGDGSVSEGEPSDYSLGPKGLSRNYIRVHDS